MWNQCFNGLAKQPNYASKQLILSVLSSTATKREAKDYLNKYAGNYQKPKYCLMFLQKPKTLTSIQMERLSGTVKKIKMLGLRLMFIVDPASSVEEGKEVLDSIVSNADLKPLHISNALTALGNSQYKSLYSSQNSALNYNDTAITPIISPYIYCEKNATTLLTQSIVDYTKNLVKNSVIDIDKFVVVNQFGGITSQERNGNPHVFVNLSQEYGKIYGQLTEQIEAFNQIIDKSKQSASSSDLDHNVKFSKLMKYEFLSHQLNLRLMHEVLLNLSPTATGLLTTIDAASFTNERRNPLIHNILTDRSLISSSLPRFKNKLVPHQSFMNSLSNSKAIVVPEKKGNGYSHENSDASLQSTVFKKGINIKCFDSPYLDSTNCIGLPEKFTRSNSTLNQNSQSKVNLIKLKKLLDASFNKSLNLEHYLDRVNGNIASIIVIGDYEGVAILTYEGPANNKFVYLDKFAVTPHLKGSLGISDIVFNLMFEKYPKELLWRSRKNNIVNKWYFQRSVAVLDLSIQLNEKSQSDSQFKLFYNGDSTTSFKAFRHIGRLQEYAIHIRDIKPSWD